MPSAFRRLANHGRAIGWLGDVDGRTVPQLVGEAMVDVAMACLVGAHGQHHVAQRPATLINVGELIRHTEDDFDLVDCPSCIIAPACGLSASLADALRAFMAVLDSRSLADLLADRQAAIARLLGGAPTSVSSPENPAPDGVLHRTARSLKREAQLT